MRGENRAKRAFKLFRLGSPPHAWGKRTRRRNSTPGGRFTPTCVGKTGREAFTLSEKAVHPHMRGENGAGGKYRVIGVGSPPHAWGKRAGRRSGRISGRFTPTCVGKTTPRARRSSSATVHPHMRGENFYEASSTTLLFGSPPHAWGKLAKPSGYACPFRFTPTCVGKTPRPPGLPGNPAVHPHMRGENVSKGHVALLDGGSPPHAWGKLMSARTELIFTRFTPTCVGKTNSVKHGATGVFGSPPHAWGKPWQARRQNVRPRFTPTCVGKTGGRVQAGQGQRGSPPHAWGKLNRKNRRPSYVPVHPHMRGENAK